MKLLAALLIAATATRVESIEVATAGDACAVRLALSGAPGRVSVQREGDLSRVSISGARLGAAFAGGHRFTWSAGGGAGDREPGALRLGRLDLAADESDVHADLSLPAGTTVEARSEPGAVCLVLHDTAALEAATRRAAADHAPQEAPASLPAAATAPDPPPAATGPAPAPDPSRSSVAPLPASVESALVAPAAEGPAVQTPSAEPAPGQLPPPQDAPASSVTELARTLFRATDATATSAESGGGTIADLYPGLFPSGVPEAQTGETLANAVDAAIAPGVPLGPFRVRASLDSRFVDADTFLGPTPTRDRFLEVGPKVVAEAPLGAGRFSADYAPVLRAFARYDRINSSSQFAGVSLDLPVSGAVTLRAGDRFASSTLDTRLVDPGGEYFFGLGHFHRNDLDAGARVLLGPRLTLELSGAAGRVRFLEQTSFFDYDSRSASAGFGFELTPGLKAIAAYVYDTVPRPAERPQAEARAHSARLSLNGELLPLLTGELSLGYRSQQNPAAAEGGRNYSGLTASGILTQRLGHESLLSLSVSRSTPASAFEGNGFYVASSIQASAEAPLPLALQLRGGVGYQWSAYRTSAAELGRPRRDQLLGWYLALRRPLPRRLTLSGTYRVENRYSNLDRFDTDSSGFMLQLEWDALGAKDR